MDTIDGLIGPLDYYPDEDEDDLIENITKLNTL